MVDFSLVSHFFLFLGHFSHLRHFLGCRMPRTIPSMTWTKCVDFNSNLLLPAYFIELKNWSEYFITEVLDTLVYVKEAYCAIQNLSQYLNSCEMRGRHLFMLEFLTEQSLLCWNLYSISFLFVSSQQFFNFFNFKSKNIYFYWKIIHFVHRTWHIKPMKYMKNFNHNVNTVRAGPSSGFRKMLCRYYNFWRCATFNRSSNTIKPVREVSLARLDLAVTITVWHASQLKTQNNHIRILCCNFVY